MRATGDVEIDPRRRDRSREDVERNVADHARGTDVAAEVLSAQGEVELRKPATRLADELAHPLAPEFVAVAVEEDVVLLLDVQRSEELRVRRPEDRLGTTGAQLEQARNPAFGVRQHEVVLRGIGAVVVV